jgi:hypothetical protein
LSAGWWEQTLRPEISQGDIVDAVPFAEIILPEIYLTKKAFPGARTSGQPVTTRTAWDRAEVLNEGPENGVLFRPRINLGVVVSHDCDIDKPNKKVFIHLAPVFPATRLEDPSKRQEVFEQRRPALMPLPEMPDVGDCYADLRRMQGVPYSLVRPLRRILSMSDDARFRLEAQLVAFYSRLQAYKQLATNV